MAEAKELVLVFLESNDGVHWTPIPRDDLPEWLRDEALWERMIAGEKVRNTFEEAERHRLKFYTATAVDRLQITDLPNAILIPPRLAGGVMLPPGAMPPPGAKVVH